MFIQTEATPNQDAIKFIPGKPVMTTSTSAEFLQAREATVSPLARRLFRVDGVRHVFLGIL
jgi:hypothetical protein